MLIQRLLMLHADAIVTCLTKKFQKLAIEIENLKAFVSDETAVMKRRKKLRVR